MTPELSAFSTSAQWDSPATWHCCEHRSEEAPSGRKSRLHVPLEPRNSERLLAMERISSTTF